MIAKRDGGYESGYAACPCFWGPSPGSYVLKLLELQPSVTGLRVLDAGCGQGKNAALLAEMGADVIAVDLSARAIDTAKANYSAARVNWLCADIIDQVWPMSYFDIVIAYGLFHCLQSVSEITALHERLSMSTKEGGYHVICSFNDRYQDLSAHPGFNPCLTSHEFYRGLYGAWDVCKISDEDLSEAHPHNLVPHTHSLTRLLARKGS